MDFTIPQKILQYESFINDVLKEQLKDTEIRLDQTYTEISDLIQTTNFIQTIQENDLMDKGIKTKVDIGCNFYMQTYVLDPSKLFLDIGLGHFVELTHTEALVILKRQTNLLNKRVDILRDQSSNTKAHIELVLHGIKELHSIK